MQFDPTQFIGLTGVPVIEQAVQYLKSEWGMPSYLAPAAALAIGVALNLGLGLYLHVDPITSTYVGLFSGFSSSFWHELSKKPASLSQPDKPAQ